MINQIDSMPEGCEEAHCTCLSLALCRCCSKYLCREHFVQHDESIRKTLNNLSETIDSMFKQIHLIDMNSLVSDAVKVLDQWCFNSHQLIDKFYQIKFQRIQQFVTDILTFQEQRATELRSKIIQLINLQKATDQDLNSLKLQIDSLGKKIKENQIISIQMEMSDLTIDENLINQEIFINYRADLSRLSCSYHSIDRLPLSSDSTAINDKCVLIHQKSNLMLLNQNLIVLKQKKWPYECIRSMCWSDTLNRFILITSTHLYTVEETTLIIKEICATQAGFHKCCTCSKNSLFILKEAKESFIEEISLRQSFNLIQKFNREKLATEKHRIDSIFYHNGVLALAVNNMSQEKKLIELRLAKHFELIWICMLEDVDYTERIMQISLFGINSWLVLDHGQSTFIEIQNDGKIMRKFDSKPSVDHFTVWTNNRLITSTTNTFNFHLL